MDALFGKAVQFIRDGYAREIPADDALLRALHRSALSATMAALEHLKRLEYGVTGAPRWARSFGATPPEVRWIERVQGALGQEIRATRGKTYTAPVAQADDAPAATSRGALRQQVAVRAHRDLLERFGGDMPDTVREPLRRVFEEGWHHQTQTGRQEMCWPTAAAAFFQEELRTDPDLAQRYHQALATQSLALLQQLQLDAELQLDKLQGQLQTGLRGLGGELSQQIAQIARACEDRLAGLEVDVQALCAELVPLAGLPDQLEAALRQLTRRPLYSKYLTDEVHESVCKIISDLAERPLVGREDQLGELDELAREGGQMRIITGPAGQGKSALLAHWIAHLERSTDAPAPFIVAHFFSGRFPQTCPLVKALQHILHQLYTYYGIEKDEPIPTDQDELRNAIGGLLRERGSRQREPLVIVIDAWDECESRPDPNWLLDIQQGAPPAGVTVVASMRSGLVAQTTHLDKWLRTGEESPLAELGRDAIKQWLSHAGNGKLSALAQDDTLVETVYQRSGGLALYLSFLMEDLVTAADPSAAVDEAPRGLGEYAKRELDRLKPSVPASDRQLASALFGTLAIARGPVSVSEVAAVHGLNTSFGGIEIPIPIRRWLSSAQSGDEMVYTFTHPRLGDEFAAVMGADAEACRNTLLAWCREHWEDSQYAVRYLPAHLADAGQHPELGTLLTDWRWIRRKLTATDVVALLADYDLLPGDEAAGLVQSALRQSAHVLSADPNQLPSQLFGRLLSWCEQGGIAQLCRAIYEDPAGPWLLATTPALTQAGDPLVRTLVGHAGWVTAVAVTADDKRAISASLDGTFKAWDLKAGREIATLKGHTLRVPAVALFAEDTRAISASDDATLKVWDLEREQAIATLEGHTGGVNAVAVFSNDTRAISASFDHTLKVWDLETEQAIDTLEGHHVGVSAVAVFSNDTRAISASLDCTLKVWSLETGQAIDTLEGHNGAVSAVAVFSNDTRAISASDDGTLRVWDLETGQAVDTLEGHNAGVSAVAVSSNDKRAISAAWDRTLKIWDLQTGQDIATLKGHGGPVTAVALTSDDGRAISASSDNTLKVWDTQTGQDTATLKGHTFSFTAIDVLYRNDRRLISGCADDTLEVWDLNTGQNTATLKGHTSYVTAVAITSDDERAISASSDNTLKVWDLKTGQDTATLKGHTGSVWAVAITSDDKRAISASDDNTLKVWDLKTGQNTATLEGHTGPVSTVTITSDDERAISASSDNTLKVWHLNTGQNTATLKGHTGSVRAVAISHDDKRAISTSADNTVKVWDIQTGQNTATLKGHTDLVCAVALWGEDTRAISASHDKTLKVWDLESEDCIATFTAEGSLRGCAVASDGRTFVVGDAGHNFHFLRLEGV